MAQVLAGVVLVAGTLAFIFWVFKPSGGNKPSGPSAIAPTIEQEKSIPSEEISVWLGPTRMKKGDIVVVGWVNASPQSPIFYKIKRATQPVRIVVVGTGEAKAFDPPLSPSDAVRFLRKTGEFRVLAEGNTMIEIVKVQPSVPIVAN
jgi:hypothetical protein